MPHTLQPGDVILHPDFPKDDLIYTGRATITDIEVEDSVGDTFTVSKSDAIFLYNDADWKRAKPIPEDAPPVSFHSTISDLDDPSEDDLPENENVDMVGKTYDYRVGDVFTNMEDDADFMVLREIKADEKGRFQKKTGYFQIINFSVVAAKYENSTAVVAQRPTIIDQPVPAVKEYGILVE